MLIEKSPLKLKTLLLSFIALVLMLPATSHAQATLNVSVAELSDFIQKIAVNSNDIPADVKTFLTGTIDGYQRADINNDGVVNSTDALAGLRYSQGAIDLLTKTQLQWIENKIVYNFIGKTLASISSNSQLVNDISNLAVGSTPNTDSKRMLKSKTGGFFRGDINNSGTITSADALIMQKFAQGDTSTMTQAQIDWITYKIIPYTVITNANTVYCRVYRGNTEYFYGAINEQSCANFKSVTEITNVIWDNEPIGTTLPLVYKTIELTVTPEFLQYQTVDEIRANFYYYVKDLNTYFRKNTSARFTFNGSVTVGTLTIGSGGPQPKNNFNIMVYISYFPPQQHNVGGFASIMNSKDNTMQANLTYVSRIFSPPEIASLSHNEYLQQIATLAHEISHTFGQGVFYEYYVLRNLPDWTNVPPYLGINISATNPDAETNFYIKKRKNVFLDHLLSERPKNLEHLRQFTPTGLTAKVVNLQAQRHNGPGANDTYNVWEWVKFASDAQLLVPVKVALVNDLTGLPVQGCAVKVYTNFSSDIKSTQTTGSDGVVYFNISNLMSSNTGSVLFKASCSGYQPAGDALTRMDLEAKALNNGGSANDFQFDGTLTLRLVP